MFRTAMSLGERGGVSECFRERQTGGQREKGEESWPDSQPLEQNRATSIRQPFLDPLSHLAEAPLRQEAGLALRSHHTQGPLPPPSTSLLGLLSHHPFSRGPFTLDCEAHFRSLGLAPHACPVGYILPSAGDVGTLLILLATFLITIILPRF